MTRITIIGASYGWTPTLLTDLMGTFEEGLELRLLDIDPEPANVCADWGRVVSKRLNRSDRFIPLTDQREALRDVDAVIITISTGGLNAMRHDLEIPERYGIFATVGDTTGPGGWSRSVRNIPVFRGFAADFAELCPNAFVVNYTNPMSALTAVLCRECDNAVVGLCHSFFEIKDDIASMFDLQSWDPISIEIAGMNHFTWVTDFNIGRQDGYTLLRDRLGNGSLRDVLPHSSADEIGFRSRHNLCVELFDHFGYLPYPADRHTSEFVSFVLTGYPDRTTTTDPDGSEFDTISAFDTRRTSIEYRLKQEVDRRESVKAAIEAIGSKAQDPPKRSRETGAQMIRAFLSNSTLCDSVNVLNVGQIPDLPAGACVETLGIVDGLGVRPLTVKHLPPKLREIMRPQAQNQEWIVEAALTGDQDLALHALYNDPLCSSMRLQDVRAMGLELLEANSNY